MHEHDLYIIIISHGPKTLCVIKVTLLFHYVIKKRFCKTEFQNGGLQRTKTEEPIISTLRNRNHK